MVGSMGEVFLPMMRTDRSLGKLIVLSILTLGIYNIIFWYQFSEDMNVVCNGDGKHTPSLVERVIFSLLTFGIYDLVWMYGVGERIYYNCQKKRIVSNTSGTSILLWQLAGALILVGPFVAAYQMIEGLNDICKVFNVYGNGPVVKIKHVHHHHHH